MVCSFNLIQLMKANKMKAAIDGVFNEIATGSPIKIESIAIGEDGVINFIYQSKEGLVIQRKVEWEVVKGEANWEIICSQNQIFPFKKVKESEDISLSFKDGVVEVQCKEPFKLTDWKQAKPDLSVYSLMEDAITKIVFTKEGWQKLVASADVAKQHKAEDKKVKDILRGVHVEWVQEDIYLTAVGNLTIANLFYSQPKSSGRKSKKHEQSGKATLSTKAIDIVNSFGGAEQKSVALYVMDGGEKALLDNHSVSVVFELIPGDYPVLDKFKPATTEKVDVSKSDLIKALETVSKDAKGELKDTEITLTCDAGQLTIHRMAGKSKDISIPAKPSKPLKAAVRILGGALLLVLKAIASSGDVAILFPATAGERLVIKTTGVLYLVLGHVVEVASFIKGKIEEISQPPASEVVESETTSDGTEIVIRKTELPQSGATPPTPETTTPQETKALLEKAAETTKSVEAAIKQESDPAQRELLEAANDHLKTLIEEAKALKDDEIKFAFSTTLFWTLERVYLIRFRLTKKFMLDISCVEKPLSPQLPQATTTGGNVVQISGRKSAK